MAPKLNPLAPEFFPLNHRLTHRHSHHHHQLQCYSNPFFLPPTPNPNPSFYYSPSSSFTNYYSNSCCYNDPSPSPLLSQTSDPLAAAANQTQPLHEASGAAANGVPVSPGGGGGRWNTKRYSDWRGSGSGSGFGFGSGFNRREKERPFINNDGKKETWRVKVGGGDASDHFRNNWKRRQDSGNGNTKNKKKPFPSTKFPVLPVESDGQNTTVMIRNIPNRYTRGLLMEFLDEHCKRVNEESLKRNEKAVSAFDFLYLPIDFENQANKGYAFVNFTTLKAVWKFQAAVDNKRWPLFLSNKVCSIAYARFQGKEELVSHFQSSVFECESDDYLPVSFRPARDGSKSSVEEKVIGTRVYFVRNI